MRFWFSASCLAAMLGTSSLAAQSGPWTIKVTPTMNPLPAGFCGAVYLTVTDAGSTEPPRNPSGPMVTIADFDLTVTATDENAVVGQRTDAYHWSVCTCQGAAPGTVATITARYPAESLAARARVPDVESETTATFETSAPKGTFNPRGCHSPAVSASAPAAPPPSRVPTTGQPIWTVPGSGAAVPREVVTPTALKNPTGFTATHRGLGMVDFAWQPVSGAVRYRVNGPGLPAAGHFVTGTILTYPKIPSGANSWKLVAIYPGNLSDSTTAAVASAMVRVLPPHSLAWLTKSNGAGSAETMQLPRAAYSSCLFGCIFLESNPPSKLVAPGSTVAARTQFTLESWLATTMNLWYVPSQQSQEAVYGNHGDLGVGRRSACAQQLEGGPVPGMYTVCYASAHGIAPGQPGFNDSASIVQPGDSTNRLLTMVIKQDPTGSVFLVYTPARKFDPSPTVTLDTEGPKFLPHVCLPCHGGTYNKTTRKVDGASFLPIDPNLQLFPGAAEKIAQQGAIRRINEIIAKSSSSPAIVAYIKGLYGNNVSSPTQHAVVDFVPPGWQAQAGLYRQVVRPYCAMCHLAASPDLNFASWGNLQDNAGRIQAAVCGAHTMPHAELQYKSFWLKDTGPVHLPGLLAASLGFASCS